MAKSPPSFKTHGRITRSDIENGLFEEMISESEKKGHFKRLPEVDRDRSRLDLLSTLPKDRDIWLFAYGSLIWSPMIEFIEKRKVRLFGYHRKFCMWTKLGRGSPDHPGLILALEPGGSTKGIAFRISRKNVEKELKLVWDREMIGGSYVPRVVKLQMIDDNKTEYVDAIAFIMNRDHENYTGKLTIEEEVNAIHGAKGPLGKCEDYLFNTVKHLDELGLSDNKLLNLANRIRKKKNPFIQN